MTKTAHTEGRLVVVEGEIWDLRQDGEPGVPLFRRDNHRRIWGRFPAPREFEATAERLVALWNACEGISNPDVVPEAIAMLHEAARWFEDYARSHYQQAKTAPSYGEQHSREVKGKLNQERCDAILAILAKLEGRS